MKEEERIRRFLGGPVYLKNEFEGIVLRMIPEGRYYAKFAGKKEYSIERSTNLVTETWLEWDEITRDEYNKF